MTTANAPADTAAGGSVLFPHEAHDALERDGYCVIEGVLSTDELDVLQTRLDEQASGEQIARAAASESGEVPTTLDSGRSERDRPSSLVPDFMRHGWMVEADDADFEQGGTGDQRVASLINKGAVFRDLVLHPLMKEMIPAVLGAPYLLSNCSANIVRTPRAGQPLHSDVHFLPANLFHTCLTINVFWLLDDYTEDNGATRVVPGSHTAAHKELVRSPNGDAVPVIAPAGSVFAFDTRLLHGAGVNTTGRPRRAIISAYCPFYFRQVENFSLQTSLEVLETAGAELRELLGLRVHSILGGVDGHYGVGAVKKGADGDTDSAGIAGFFVDRPVAPRGPLAADGSPLARTD